MSNYVVWDPAREPRCGPPDGPIYCHPDAYRGLPCALFHNNRDGTFTDVSQASGIGRHIGKGMGVAFADDSVRSFMFRNQGDGTFRELGLEAGVALREDGASIAGMGADFRDFDNDGLPDLVVSRMINDSFLLFRSVGGRRFEDVSGGAGADFQRAALHHGAAFADFDNDGRVDVAVSVLNGPAKLFRNVSGGGQHWLGVKLRGRRSNRQGLGAVVWVTLPVGRTQQLVNVKADRIVEVEEAAGP